MIDLESSIELIINLAVDADSIILWPLLTSTVFGIPAHIAASMSVSLSPMIQEFVISIRYLFLAAINIPGLGFLQSQSDWGAWGQ